MPTNKWLHVVKVGDVANDDSLSFRQKRDEIAKRLRSEFTKEVSQGTEIQALISDLESSVDVEEFDTALDSIYDWGDRGKRLWLEMF